MIFRAKGIPNCIEDLLVGVITRDPHCKEQNRIYIGQTFEPERFLATLSCNALSNSNFPCISETSSLDHLEDGDIVSLSPDGIVRTVYRANSFYNTILATERCNSNCLMCSQPPKDKNDVPYLFELYRRVIPLIPKNCLELTVSGGEPTLMGEQFFLLLEQITKELPETDVHVLTNGRAFAWDQIAERVSKVNNPRMMLGIPLYADYDLIHDYIVQAKDAFDQTILGLHNLARYSIRLEIRIVLHKQSIPRLTRLAKYIFKNLPFAEHVTFMGLEHTGYTPHNIDKLWIDPFEYNEELTESVEFLARQGMHVSIYNAQLCVMPERLWLYARKSISDWKNDYLPTCRSCSQLEACGGLFTWNLKKYSDHIHPIKKAELLHTT